MQEGLPTIGDIYDVCIETDKGVSEKLQVFDTPGDVSGYRTLSRYSCTRRSAEYQIVHKQW